MHGYSKSQEMTFNIVMMTPEKAKHLLKTNFLNRKIRKSWVDELSSIIKADAWKLSHQGVAVSNDGRLLDGQHRLIAISLSGKTVPIVVAENCDESLFSIIDKGVKRKLCDSLRIDQSYAEAHSILLKIAVNAKSDRPDLVEKLIDSEIGNHINMLLENCKTTRRIATSAPVKAAAAMAMASVRNPEEVAYNYQNFVTLKYNEMTPSLLYMEKQIAKGKLSATENKLRLYSIFFKAFSSLQMKRSIVHVNDDEHNEIIRLTKAYISKIIKP